MAKPTIKNAPGTRDAALRGETLREVYSRKLQRGCLLAIGHRTNMHTEEQVIIDVYRGDPGVFVRTVLGDLPCGDDPDGRSLPSLTRQDWDLIRDLLGRTHGARQERAAALLAKLQTINPQAREE